MGDCLNSEPQAVRLRPVDANDHDFLVQLYASTRAGELAVLPWSEEAKANFVAMQFAAQDDHYRRSYPGGRFLVVTRAGIPIGRLYLAVLDDEVRVIDIALMPDHRGAGIGSRLMADLISEADSAGLPVRLHVEPWNPARRLYQRLGFRTLHPGAVYELMERMPAGHERVS